MKLDTFDMGPDEYLYLIRETFFHEQAHEGLLMKLGLFIRNHKSP